MSLNETEKNRLKNTETKTKYRNEGEERREEEDTKDGRKEGERKRGGEGEGMLQQKGQGIKVGKWRNWRNIEEKRGEKEVRKEEGKPNTK